MSATRTAALKLTYCTLACAAGGDEAVLGWEALEAAWLPVALGGTTLLALPSGGEGLGLLGGWERGWDHVVGFGHHGTGVLYFVVGCVRAFSTHVLKTGSERNGARPKITRVAASES